MLVGVGKMDDGIKKAPGRNLLGERVERKVVNIEAEVIEAVNGYADALEDKLGFRPTFSQALRYIVKELKKK